MTWPVQLSAPPPIPTTLENDRRLTHTVGALEPAGTTQTRVDGQSIDPHR